MSLYWHSVEPQEISHSAFSSQFVESVERGGPGLSPVWAQGLAVILGGEPPPRDLGGLRLLPCGHSQVGSWHLQQMSYHTSRVGLGQPFHFRSYGHFLEPLPRGQVSPSWLGKPMVSPVRLVLHLRPGFYNVSQKDETPVVNLKYSLLQSTQYLKTGRLFVLVKCCVLSLCSLAWLNTFLLTLYNMFT